MPGTNGTDGAQGLPGPKGIAGFKGDRGMRSYIYMYERTPSIKNPEVSKVCFWFDLNSTCYGIIQVNDSLVYNAVFIMKIV